ncbi:phenylalanine--tRNA ligase subunit beta [Nocardioides caldifontis]|uniref:phenylalanine--tRNA ligase subunit beta n=1 Tax=Nocardioides caldifontis TaxID=2588938 RepID=UPI0011DF5DD3|nr:phenylalanine--tRNA ligase subunit beta [Nocardioides caldifontis]
MRAPVSWIRELVELPADVTTEKLTDRLTMLGLKLEAVERAGGDIQGPLVLGRVLSLAEEPQKNGKIIRWCQVDVGDANGTGEPQGIVCGAHNFAEGDLVVVVLPGGVLPGGFAISARKTYGHVSAGMICSARELGIGDDHDGIMVLPADAGQPGDDAFGYLGLDEEVIDLEINPDRAYALSLRGIAREAALGFGVPFQDPALRATPEPNGTGYPVVVDAPDGCPVFVTRTVTGFDPSAPTPRWMAQRLQQAGMRPISLAVDVTNYVMLELGQPIHGYDGDRLSGPIRVRRAVEGERLTTLDGVERTLSAEDLLITDDSGPIGLAGVMGGETTELSATTSHVVIEAAHFDPVSIFRTQRRHKLPSEASKRFERGVDPLLPEAAADRVAELLVAHGGGTVTDGVTKVGAAPEPRSITIPTGLPARVTGMEIPAHTAVANLESVGCGVTVDGGSLTAVVPSWRPDLNDPFDLVEEVARIVGYDKVPSVLPAAPAGRGLTPAQSLRRRVGRALAGAGFVEVVSFPFTGPAALDALGLDEDDERRNTMRIANALSNEQPYMTTTLLPGLLETAARNAGRGQPDVALFETATVTLPRGTVAAPILPVDRRPTPGEWDDLQKALPDQPLHLAVVLTGERERTGWWGPGRAATWSDAIQAVRDVAQVLGVEVEVRSASVAPWHPGRCAELLVGDVSLGHAGELHPKVCTAFGLPARAAAAEIDLDLLLERAAPPSGPVVSSFPVAKEDVALVVDAALPAGELAATLREGAGELLESVRLFDLYTGAQVGGGKKSLAFALRFRAPDRTLNDEEITAAREGAVALAAERHGAVLRG